MQRVRIGLTGLGFVFVAVLLSTALTNETSNEQPVTGNTATPAANAAAPQEPLAQLGVAPGNADANVIAANVAQAQPGAQ
jgi:hypothetical protein